MTNDSTRGGPEPPGEKGKDAERRRERGGWGEGYLPKGKWKQLLRTKKKAPIALLKAT